MVIEIVIKGNPITKKNSQRVLKNRKTGRLFIAPSKQYDIYQRYAGVYLLRHSGLMIDKPVNIKCVFYMGTRRAVDLTNLLESVDDILTHYHVIADDNCKIVASHDGSHVLYDKENPRVEITIREKDAEKAERVEKTLEMLKSKVSEEEAKALEYAIWRVFETR